MYNVILKHSCILNFQFHKFWGIFDYKKSFGASRLHELYVNSNCKSALLQTESFRQFVSIWTINTQGGFLIF